MDRSFLLALVFIACIDWISVNFIGSFQICRLSKGVSEGRAVTIERCI